MSAVCPSCGVAVVPGYVRCPRCQASLPMSSGRIRRVADPGGTSVARDAFPIAPVIAAVAVAGAIIAYFALRGGGSKPAPRLASPARPNEAAPAVVEPGASPPPPSSTLASVAAPAPAADPVVAAGELERQLKRARLWSTVQVTGGRLEIRSASCADPLMVQAIDGARGSLRGAGLTRLRCLAQSGAVVFERDL